MIACLCSAQILIVQSVVDDMYNYTRGNCAHTNIHINRYVRKENVLVPTRLM